MAAPIMNQALRHFRGRHVLGLSATLERPDGMTPLLHHCLGQVGFHIDRERGCEPVRVSIAMFDGPETDVVGRDGKTLDPITLNKIAGNRERSAFLARRVVAMRRAGRTVVVISDRNAQLEVLHGMLITRLRDAFRVRVSASTLARLFAAAAFPVAMPAEIVEKIHALAVAAATRDMSVGLFVGKTRAKDRPGQLAMPTLLTNYSMAAEGLDVVALDTLVFATPKARITQAVGRIQRPCATKKRPLVLDLVDKHAMVHLHHARRRFYQREEYETQTLDTSTAQDCEWFS